MKVNVQLQLSKEAYELSKGLADLVVAIKACVADGWQPGQDIPVIISEVIGKLVPALAGTEKLPEEFKVDPYASSLAIAIPLIEMIGKLIKPKEAA